ncbi:unnamed protein product [Cylicostephanus goldi]|uniref:DUF1248 domain-containing protein n=1 Tax=Cylicostephanus goldi TaxID=71465 RepID=A0A3P7N0Q5_CYLGO|nr:unnamed protein product [Cylicostephanus goldi]
MAKAEWPLTLEDLTAWKNSFGEKFWLFIAIEKEKKESVACVMGLSEATAVEKEEDKEYVYIVGLYFVREDWRKHDVGTTLFNKFMEVAGESNKALLSGKLNYL